MPVVTLDDAKLHLRVIGDDENSLINRLVEAAQEQAQAYVNRNVYESQAALEAAVAAGTAGCAPMVANASFRSAMLLIVGHLYGNREEVVVGTSVAQLPYASQSLLAPWRIGWGA